MCTGNYCSLIRSVRWANPLSSRSSIVRSTQSVWMSMMCTYCASGSSAADAGAGSEPRAAAAAKAPRRRARSAARLEGAAAAFLDAEAECSEDESGALQAQRSAVPSLTETLLAGDKEPGGHPARICCSRQTATCAGEDGHDDSPGSYEADFIDDGTTPRHSASQAPLRCANHVDACGSLIALRPTVYHIATAVKVLAPMCKSWSLQQ